jgi:hypothetical protein
MSTLERPKSEKTLGKSSVTPHSSAPLLMSLASAPAELRSLPPASNDMHEIDARIGFVFVERIPAEPSTTGWRH